MRQSLHQALEICQPNDFHLHVRDEDMMRLVLPFSARVFGKAIIMPNLVPPVRTTEQALAYRGRILSALQGVEGTENFDPLMTLYLTDTTTPDEVVKASESGFVYGVKLYPAGATTNSQNGVTDLASVEPVLQAMEAVGLPLLIHGEVTSADIFDREEVFLRECLVPLLESHPNLRVVVEHVTTKAMVDFVTQSTHKHLGATITPHHLMYSRAALFQGPGGHGTALNPHLFCLPVLKRDSDRDALVAAATSLNPRFFAGTDSAPHPRRTKECGCCSAGVFCAPVALEAYATVFDSVGCLDRLEAFVSFHGADFYGIARNTRRVRLVKEPQQIPNAYRQTKSENPADEVVPLCAGGSLPWTVDLTSN